MLPEELKEDYTSFVLADTESPEYAVVKLADRLSAYLKCVEEVKAGNSEFKKAKTSIGKELKDKALKYFMENMLPAYELTLDELD